MSRPKKILPGLVALLLSAALAWMTCHRKGDPQDLVISTGTEGGTYIKLGQLLAPILEASGEPIREVSWVPSEGSFQNIDRLRYTDNNLCEPPREGRDADALKPDALRDASNCKAHLAFVVASAVKPDDGVQVLMSLYKDVLQLVVRKEINHKEIKKLSDLKGVPTFVGNDGSATQMISRRVLDEAGIEVAEVELAGFQEAADELKKEGGKIKAAFFMAGIPVDAVSAAMRSGCCRILPVDSETAKTEFGLKEKTIPRLLYQNQPEPVQTLEANALLVAREGLSAEIVQAILNALFDHVGELAVANIRANEIRLWKAFDLSNGGEGLKLHPGAENFKEIEKHALLIATGSIGGKYYNVGQMIQRLLQQRNIRDLGLWTALKELVSRLLFDRDRARARVVHTNGSLENADLLERPDDLTLPRPTLAIMQYDIALASRLEKSPIYRAKLKGIKFPSLPTLKRIATLHKETLYVIARRKMVPGDQPTLRDLKNLKVDLGPKQSGTHAIAEAVLEHHGICKDPTDPSCKDPIIPSYLMVPDMVHRLHSGDIHAGFIVSGLPSHAVETLLNDPDLRLVSLGPRERAKIVESAAFYAETIPAKKYACQWDTEPDIQTIATHAVLVANEELDFDVEVITKAIFEGAAFLDLGVSALDVSASSMATGEDPRQRLLRLMAQDLPSLPLHPSAKAYYEKAGLRPIPPRLVDYLNNLLTATWRSLTVLLILVSISAYFIRLKRDRTSNWIGRSIVDIALPREPSPPLSPVSKLAELKKKRGDIRERVRKRWWQLEELDRSRSRDLHDLVQDLRREATGELTRDLVKQLGGVREDARLNDAQRLDRRNDLLQRVRKYLEDDEIEASQYELLTKLIQEELPERASAEVR